MAKPLKTDTGRRKKRWGEPEGDEQGQDDGSSRLRPDGIGQTDFHSQGGVYEQNLMGTNEATVYRGDHYEHYSGDAADAARSEVHRESGGSPDGGFGGGVSSPGGGWGRGRGFGK